MKKHPTSDQIRTVLANFAKVLTIANGHEHLLSMNEGRLSPILVERTTTLDGQLMREVYTCGSPMCHGGWYMTAVWDINEDGDFRNNNYSDGAEKMNKDLGGIEIEYWADQNPKIWGNSMGYRMFSDRSAFEHETKRPNGAKSLQHIVDHWNEVLERIVELEKDPLFNPEIEVVLEAYNEPDEEEVRDGQ